MRFLRLGLDAFGPFYGNSLDLSAGTYGLHLVYGPNEAGKTSALRAMVQLLFEIPVHSKDNFLVEHKKMRLSATLGRSDGSILDFIRHKRSKNPLTLADGVTTLDPSRLEGFLGGIDQPTFETMFGIGHEALIRGGREILNGGGKLGELLFTAGSGIAGLKGIKDSLQAERLLFLSESGKGKKERIPLAIAKVVDARAEIKGNSVKPEDWSRREQAFREATLERGRLEELHLERFRESKRLGRIRESLQHISERAQLLDSLKKLGDVVKLGEDFADRRRRLENDRDRAVIEADRARQAIERLQARIAGFLVDRGVLEAAEDIEALYVRRAEYLKGQENRPLRARDVQEHEHAAREILQGLGRPRDLAEAEVFQYRVDDDAVIQQLALESARVATRRQNASDAIDRYRLRAQKARRGLPGEAPTLDLGALKATLKSVVKLGDLEAQLDEARSSLEPVEKSLLIANRGLPGWSGTPDSLEQMTVPLPETIERFDSQFRLAETRRLELVADRSRKESGIAELETRLRIEDPRGDLPTEEDLARSRAIREQGWLLVRRAWLDRRVDPALEQDFVDVTSPGRSLAEAFEQSGLKADTLADRLRREASDVARRAERLASLEVHRTQLSKLEREETAASLREESLDLEWAGLVSKLGLPKFDRSEFRSWLVERQKVLELLVDVSKSRKQVEQFVSRIAAQVKRLTSVMIEMGADAISESEGLSGVIQRSESWIEKHESANRDREAVADELAKAEADLAEAELALARSEAEREVWKLSWAVNMAKIGLEPEATPEQATLFTGEIRKLRVEVDRARSFRNTVRKIDIQAEQFVEDVGRLARRVDFDLSDLPPDRATEALHSRLLANREADQALRSLREQAEAGRGELEAADHLRVLAASGLVGLCREAGCETVAGLPEAERRSLLCLRFEADLHRCEDQIRSQSAGASIEEFIKEADEIDPDGLDLVIAGLAEEVAKLQEQRDEVNQRIGSAKTLLDAIDGGSKAAEADEKAGYALAELQSDVPRYAALRIAAHVLQQGIERYRQRSQGPLIDRASQLFATLTAGSFRELRVDTDDKGVFLVGVRPDNETTLKVEAMSDGSCDQLYLALRIAGLENWLDNHDPIPLIVDDILLQFDDDRSRAALRVLADLSKKTQVIFFTHHAHLVELARDEFDDETLFVHNLASSRPAPEPMSAPAMT